ncbi:MAG: FkbM family methyltransferase [Pseudomonadota bacterium]
MISTTEAYGFQFAYPSGDTAVGYCLREHGEFSRVGATLAMQISRGRTFIDVGANIGAIALPVSRQAKRVIAIEAHPDLANILKQNVHENEITNIDVIHAAAGATRGDVNFPAMPLDSTGNFGMSGFGREGELIKIQMMTLDEISPPDTAMIKVDVEGYEHEVLAGAKDTLRIKRPHLLVEVSADSLSTQPTIDILTSSNYQLYWFVDPFVTPRAPKAPWQGKRKGDIHVFAVPAEASQPDDMTPVRVGEPYPSGLDGYRYLKAFGFRIP